jgi:multidrug efflux pump subunit AcrA (membrane-fusion protein)
MKKVKMLTAIASTIVVAVAITGCSQGSSSTNTTAKVTKTVKNTIEASGVVKASNSENLVVDFGQSVPKITKLDVVEGQTVKKGDKLVELDMTDVNAAVTQAQESVAIDKQTKAADEQTENAAVQKKNIDVIAKNSATTDDQKNTADDTINSDNDNIAAADAKLKADDDKIAIDEAQLNALNAKLSKSYLKNGALVCDLNNAVVTGLTYNTGDLASSAKAVLTLQDLNSLYIQANVGEEFIKDVQVGKTVNITPTANPNKILTGKVTSIASEAITENGDTYIPVNISIDNNNNTVLPNYNVDVEINK